LNNANLFRLERRFTKANTEHMKKFLMISGVIFWVLVFIAAAFFIRGMMLDASSKAYVDKHIPVILSTWSETEILKCASIELKAVMSDKQSGFDQALTNFSKLGALEKYNGSKGQAFEDAYFSVKKKGKRSFEITARYVVEASFQNGNAEIKVDLTRENGDWKIYSLNIDSPMSQKN
jgi:hypothetical protein